MSVSFKCELRRYCYTDKDDSKGFESCEKCCIGELQADAERYRYIRDSYVSKECGNMKGTSEFRIHTIYGRAETFDKLLDVKIQEVVETKV